MEPKRVVKLLLDDFGTSNDEPTSRDLLMFHQIRRQLQHSEFEVETIDTLDYDDCESDDDGDQEPADSDDDSNVPPSPEKRVKADNVDDAYLENAYRFWTHQPMDTRLVVEKGGKRRIQSSVISKYKKLNNRFHLLYRYEDSKLNLNPIKQINERVKEIFLDMRSKNAIVHDRSIRMWALQVKQEHGLDIPFKASSSWLYKFKQRNKIVSRSITHKVGKSFRQDDEKKQKTAEEFVTKTKKVIEQLKLLPSQVFNADQSRFDKELHSGRTLSFQGGKRIYAEVGSASATTHSYMIYPVVSMDGKVMSPMYLLCTEPSGHFPANKCADPPNIRSYAGKSANMTKDNVKEFMTDVFWPSIHQDKLLLLVDSWRTNKVEDLVQKPENVELTRLLIPDGCTSLIQPLDVFFFRPYKNFVKYVTDTVLISSNFKIWQRANFINLQSLTHFQFTAPIFQNMIRYAFYKTRYLDDEPEPFITPVDYCFNFNTGETCHEPDCPSISFFRCAHCSSHFCLNHTIILTVHNSCN